MHRNWLRTLASLLVLAILVSTILVAGSGTSLAGDIAYYEVASISYHQAADIPFAVTITARDALHDPVGDGAATLTISSNAHSMTFDTNSNGIFGEPSDSSGTLSGGTLTMQARDTVPARGAIITVIDASSIQGSSQPYAISSTKVVSPDGWAWQNPLPQGNNLRGISGTSSSDIFAVGDAGTIMHYNGNVWIPMPSGTAADLCGVWASTPTDVYAAGTSGVLHYDGLTWTTVRSAANLRAISGASSSSVFAVGDGGAFLRYDGATWSEVGKFTGNNLNGVWGASPSDVFAVGDGGTIVRYQAGSASSSSTAGGQAYRGIWGTSSSDVFAAGDNGAIAHFDGSNWTAMTSSTTSNLCGIWGSASSDVIAIGEDGAILHYDGSAWTTVSSGTTSSLAAVWGSPDGERMAIGDAGLILHREGDLWLPRSSGPTATLHGIWGSSPSDVFAVGEGGTVLHYDGAAWTPMDSGTTTVLLDIWGTSSSDIFAVGVGGLRLHYDGSAWSIMGDGGSTLYAVWGSSPSDVFAAGESGTVLHYDGTNWTTVDSGTVARINDLWGTSSANVFGVGTGGTALHYDGFAWSPMSGGTAANLLAIWGSSSLDVHIVGAEGTALHYDGVSWAALNSGTAEDPWGVWGSSASDVFAVGTSGTLLNYDGSAWTSMSSASNGHLLDIWGSSDTSIFAVGYGGVILHYRQPVPVTVAAVTPGNGGLGQTFDITISGTDLKGATGLTFGLGVAITVNGFTIETPSRIKANITIADDAALGARNVHVFTDTGEGILYSGFAVTEAPPPLPDNARTGWLLIIWIILGILGAAALGVLAFFLSQRRRRGLSPAGPQPRPLARQKPEGEVTPAQPLPFTAAVEPPSQPPIIEKPAPEAAQTHDRPVWEVEEPQPPQQEASAAPKPGGQAKPIHSPPPVDKEKLSSEAVPVESISIATLRAVLDGRARAAGPGRAAGVDKKTDRGNAGSIPPEERGTLEEGRPERDID